MSLEQPSMTKGYLHQVLVDGVTPFRYRSNVRSLLGMSDNDVNPPPAANLPPIEFFYATGRSPSMMAHSALIDREDQNVANTASVDGEDSPTLDPLDRPRRHLLSQTYRRAYLLYSPRQHSDCLLRSQNLLRNSLSVQG